MRAIRICALLAVMAALLAGCQSAKDQEKIPQPEKSSLGRVIDSPVLTGTPSQRGNGEQTEVKADSLKEDSMKAFYERMRRWDALHGGMRQRESDK